MGFDLYPDQVELQNAVRGAYHQGFRAPIICSPTGSGKTVLAVDIMRGAEQKGGSTLVLTHRIEILNQFDTTARKHGLENIGHVLPGRSEMPWQTHHLAMVQTLVRRLRQTRLDPNLIIVDEGHHAAASTYRRILERWPNAKLAGLSATPERPDGKGLDDVFDTIVMGLGMRDLIALGRLAPYELFEVPTGIEEGKAKSRGGDFDRHDLEEDLLSNKKIANVHRAILEHAQGRRWIAFGPSIRASQELESRLLASGVNCRHIDGELTKFDRRSILQSFDSGQIDGLLSVDLVSEGFDCPAADCAILYRRTKSHVVYLQAVGRVLREGPGKVARVLDCCGLWRTHGRPCDHRDWSLSGRAGAKTENTGEKFRVCPSCFLMQPVGPPACIGCGEIFNTATRTPDQVLDVSLVKVQGTEAMEGLIVERRKNGKYTQGSLFRARCDAHKAGGDEAIKELGLRLGFKPGWADRQIDFHRRYQRTRK